MKIITKSYEIKSDIGSVWDCLTNSEQMNKWGAEPSNFDLKIGGEFNMWGEYLTGKVTDFSVQEFIEEDWLVEGMSKPSIVRFELKADGDTTSIQLIHTEVPDQLESELSEGWDQYYLGAIKSYLE